MNDRARHTSAPRPIQAPSVARHTRIAQGVAQDGFALERDFLPAATIDALARELRRRAAAGRLKPAGIGAADSFRVAPDERGDRISWLEPPLARSEADLFAALELLRLELNRELGLGAFSLECHYAVYEPGARYVRHLDRSAGGRERVISLTLYLNRHWRASDGGALVLYGHSPVAVLPAAGTLVVFRSERLEHEVEPAVRDRLSVAGWFSRRSAVPSRTCPSISG
jgi:SM-20-related protein